MYTGIALAFSELSTELIQKHQLDRRIFARGGEQEIRFLTHQAERLLPIWHQGQMRLVRWGCRRGDSKILPCNVWTWKASVEAGRWADWHGESVEIPATLGLENGVWFRILQGIRGILARDSQGVEAVYMICEPATHYYEIMTRSKRMPVLIDELI